MEHFRQATFKNKLIIICFGFIFGSFFTVFSGYPILFQHPDMLCLNKVENAYFKCSSEIACSLQYKNNFKLNSTNIPRSLTFQFNIFCEREYLRRLSISIIYAGGYFCLIGIFFFQINKNTRKNIFVICGLLNGICSLLSLLFQNLIFISIMLSLSTGCFLNFVGNYAAFLNENFDAKLADFSILLINFIYGVFGVLFVLICYFTYSNWKILSIICFSLSFIPALIIYFTNPDKTQV